MKVILNVDIKGVGKKGQIINASDGYARNYLLPRKFAVSATGGNLTSLNEKKEAEKYRKQNEREKAFETAKKLSGLKVLFKVKAGENGKLFGSITSKDIAGEIKKQHGFEIDKRKIVLDEPIKSEGIYNIEVKVYPEINAKLKVEVTAE
ncbi:MAG: 50S ribosomal protein L9 [Clostridiales bacterium]|nr:50S ribosomal protein L9 [Clostridiales bacterium]HBM82014.1 50S ribosomal protein L9 [Clostridiaceae bacterium]